MVEKLKLNISTPKKEYDLEIRKGLGLQAVALKHKVPMDFDCRDADCGICIFKVKNRPENLTPPTAKEKDFLKAMHADTDERLACQCAVRGPIDIEFEY